MGAPPASQGDCGSTHQQAKEIVGAPPASQGDCGSTHQQAKEIVGAVAQVMRLESVHKLVDFSTFSLILVQTFIFATAPVRVNLH